tara:strand:+ start:273 stop:1370 length:1098 start_codon:yes stop_codon:yes gene_type:complete
MADDKKIQPYPSYMIPDYGDIPEGPTLGDLFFPKRDVEGTYDPEDYPAYEIPKSNIKPRNDYERPFDIRDIAGEGLSPSEIIDIMRKKKIKDAKDEKALTAKEDYRMKGQTEATKKAQDRRKKMAEAAKEAAKEAEKFVPRDTVLGRIFDERVREGEEISNRDKAFAYIRNISDNLLERRLVGGKEGTDTLSRILGPGGGVEGGRLEVEALEDEAIALREKGETKQAAAIDKLLERQKTAYEIKKIDSEAMKNIAEAAKSDYSKATQGAMELATIRGFTPGTAEYMAEVDAILSVAVTEGQASIIKDVADLQSQLSIMDPDSDEYKAMQDRINMLQRQSVGTTINTDAYSLPEMTLNPDGSPRTS